MQDCKVKFLRVDTKHKGKKQSFEISFFFFAKNVSLKNKLLHSINKQHIQMLCPLINFYESVSQETQTERKLYYLMIPKHFRIDHCQNYSYPTK